MSAVLVGGLSGQARAALDISISQNACVYCPVPYLQTGGYGPLSLCIQINSSKTWGRSTVCTDRWVCGSEGTWLKVTNSGRHQRLNHKNTDGQGSERQFIGQGILDSGCCGPVTYGVEYAWLGGWGGRYYGRWGNYNHYTHLFSPDGQWSPM